MAEEGRVVIALAPCFGCRRVFAFDPERVTAIPVDPVTMLPPDLGGDPDRAQNCPLCNPCIDKANPVRIAAGLLPLPRNVH